MIDILVWIAGFLMTSLFGLIAWVLKMIFGTVKKQRDDHDTLSKSLSDHKLHAAETFVHKNDLRDFVDRVMVKLDKIDDKLDKKADK